MQQVVAAFMLRPPFEPSFWLDKACIDQENIAAPVKRHSSDRYIGAPVLTEEQMKSMQAAALATAIHLGHI